MADYKVHALELPNGYKITLSPFAYNTSVPLDNLDPTTEQISDIKRRIENMKKKEDEDLLWSVAP